MLIAYHAEKVEQLGNRDTHTCGDSVIWKHLLEVFRPLSLEWISDIEYRQKRAPDKLKERKGSEALWILRDKCVTNLWTRP